MLVLALLESTSLWLCQAFNFVVSCLQITVNYPDGSPAEGKFITLNAESRTVSNRLYNNIYSNNFTSPASGIIEFEIPDVDIETSSLSLHVSTN